MPEYCDTAEDLGAILKYMLANRLETITLSTTFTKAEEVTALLKCVSSVHRETSTELCEYSSFAESLSYGYRGYEGREYQINLTLISNHVKAWDLVSPFPHCLLLQEAPAGLTS